MMTSNSDDTITLETKTLELVKYNLVETLGATSLSSLKLDFSKDFLSNRIKYKLEFDILQDKLVQDRYKCYFYYKEPINWWEHFKKDKAPKWFIKKYPVKFKTHKRHKTIEFTRYAEYPKSNFNLRSNRLLYSNLGNYERIKDVIREI